MSQLYIDRDWGDSESSAGTGVVSPISGGVINTVPRATDRHVAAVITAVRRAQAEPGVMIAFKRVTVSRGMTVYFEAHENETTEKGRNPLHGSHGQTTAVVEPSEDYGHAAANHPRMGGAGLLETSNRWERLLPFGGYGSAVSANDRAVSGS